MPVITNAELKRRLEAHNYPVPPITDSTKRILIKKLAQLDSDRNGGKTRQTKKLFDYSSAEDDSAPSTPSLRRRAVIASASTKNGATSEHKKKANGNGHKHKGQLMHFSESEGDEEDDDDEKDNSSDEADENNDSEEEEDTVERVDFGLQTSPGLDNSHDSTFHDFRSPSADNFSPSSSETRPRSGRFSSSTPVGPIRSTATYLDGGSKSTPKSAQPLAFPPTSPLRRAVAKNKAAFGSLGEALATLPSMSHQQNANSSADQVVSQVAKPEVETPTFLSRHVNNKRPSSVAYFSVSKIIVTFAVFFFGFVLLKYYNLKPRMDIENRLRVCAGDAQQGDCIEQDLVPICVKIFNELILVLDSHSAEVKCNASQRPYEGLTLTELTSSLQNEAVENISLRSVLLHLISVIEETPHFGIEVVRDVDQQTTLMQHNPHVDWICWLSLRLKLAATVAIYLGIALGIGGLVSGAAYGSYRLYKWRAEVILREQQDVFELVEQVLSLLMKHHHHQMSMQDGRQGSGRSINRASVPVSHVRDQLIAPQDRKRKQRVWQKVVQYIHESESRVREDVQILYGEEHRVWQWIPDIQWSPMSHPGPNPYVAPLHVIQSQATLSPTTPTSSTSIMSSPSLSHSVSQNSKWQGSAFNSLNHNVAAPSVAPTSCLKVRHMFDQTLKAKSKNWVRLVTDEILTRCSNAAILHIAVDRESVEGCVYIKAKSTEAAAKVFKTLHGQWYRGNLVTAKYLRDERYFEKFPDAKHQYYPMRPGLEVGIKR